MFVTQFPVSSSQIGQQFEYRGLLPLIGATALTSYSDTTTGETLTRFWIKEFRYSVGGVIFSEWTPLTNGAITAITGFTQTDDIQFYFRYTHGGTAPGSLSWQAISINATIVLVAPNAPVTEASFIAPYAFNDPKTDFIALNLLRKFYGPGIIPTPIIRGQTTNPLIDDADFITIWRGVAQMFAVIIRLAERFQNLQNDPELLWHYMEQRGIYQNPNDNFAGGLALPSDLTQSQYLSQYFLDEIRKRGTIQMIATANTLVNLSSPALTPIDGEILRLVGVNGSEGMVLNGGKTQQNDEFIFCLDPPQLAGFWIGNGGPMYQGLSQYDGFINIMFLERLLGGQADISGDTLQNFEVNSPTSTVNWGWGPDLVDGDKTVAFFRPIGGLPTSQFGIYPVTNNLYAINNAVSHEFTLFIRQTGTGGNITIGFIFYDDMGAVISNVVVLNAIAIPNDGTYWFVRAIAYESGYTIPLINRPNVDLTNLNAGLNCVMPVGTVQAYPYVLFHADNMDNEFRVWDVKMRPLAFPEPQQFVGLTNAVRMWSPNKSQKYSDQQLEQILRRDLLPYNVTLLANWIPPHFDTSRIGEFSNDFNIDDEFD